MPVKREGITKILSALLALAFRSAASTSPMFVTGWEIKSIPTVAAARRANIGNKRDAGKVLTWPGQRYGNASAHRIVADTSDNGNAPFARFKQGFYDVTSASDQYIGPISHESGG